MTTAAETPEDRAALDRRALRANTRFDEVRRLKDTIRAEVRELGAGDPSEHQEERRFRAKAASLAFERLWQTMAALYAPDELAGMRDSDRAWVLSHRAGLELEVRSIRDLVTAYADAFPLAVVQA